MTGGPAARFRAFGTNAARSDDVETERHALGLLVRSWDGDLNLAAWLAPREDWLAESLVQHGAVLLRGFTVDSGEAFMEAVTAHGDQPLAYEDAHTPRTNLGDGLYTSTEYPADHEVPMHSENSKNRSWPRRVWFCCQRPAATGGATPLADNRRVFEHVSSATRRTLAAAGVRYIRRLGLGLGLGWREALGVADESEVAERCAVLGLEHLWRDDGVLELSQLGPGTAVHPETGEEVWFNQAHLFHRSTLAPSVRAALEEVSGERDLPSDVQLGDGSPIPPDTIREINEAFVAARVEGPWERGDVLVVDNMLMAHGRRPYTGDRRVLVAMTRKHDGADEETEG